MLEQFEHHSYVESNFELNIFLITTQESNSNY